MGKANYPDTDKTLPAQGWK